MSIFDKITMYITSMMPVILVIAVTHIYESITLTSEQPFTYSRKMVFIIVLSFVFSLIWVYLRLSYLIRASDKTDGTQTGRKIEICKINRNKGISIEYLMSFTLAIAVIENYIVTIIYLIILGYIYVKYNLVKYNLCLELCRYTLYDCEIKGSGRQITIYSKTKLTDNSYSIQIVDLSDDTALLTDCFEEQQE